MMRKSNPIASPSRLDRSSIMRLIRSTDTKPEKLLRKIARDIRLGYRLNKSDVPGRPDIIYTRQNKAMFLHGCFWHGHDCARGRRVPKTNQIYWIEKIGRTRARDRENLTTLEESGWTTLVIWECELKTLESVREKVRAFLI